MLQPHQQRVVNEFQDLQQKVTSLNAFLSKPEARQLAGEIEYERLQTQFLLMVAYQSLLALRIGDFQQNNNNGSGRL